jgi:hypothetical protein
MSLGYPIFIFRWKVITDESLEPINDKAENNQKEED